MSDDVLITLLCCLGPIVLAVMAIMAVGGGGFLIISSSPPNVEKLKAKGNVKGLIKALGYKKNGTIRKAAAEALVALYESGKLNDEHKKLILSERDTITQKHSDWAGGHSDRHTDRAKHSDRETDCLIGVSRHIDHPAENKHVDKNGEHTDTGIGVDFPL